MPIGNRWTYRAAAALVAQIQSLETELSALQAELAGLDDGVEEEEEPPADEDDSSRGNVGN